MFTSLKKSLKKLKDRFTAMAQFTESKSNVIKTVTIEKNNVTENFYTSV